MVRSSPGATLTHLGVGRYDVNFTAAVGSCAYLASVGDPANALVYYPSGVYTGTGSAANSVYVETKNPGRALCQRQGTGRPEGRFGPAGLPRD